MSLYRTLAALACILGPTASLPAQEPAPAERIPPQVLLGRRAEVLRLSLKVRPTVVIVTGRDDFVRAVARWSLAERFPILIDDGSDSAREDIGRFVRAFEPENVLRWTSGAPEGDRLPEAPDEFRLAIETAARLSWGARTTEELATVWEQTQFSPFGVVVASPADPAWTAALALSAGRGQPIIWLDTKPGSVSQFISEEQAAALDTTLSGRLNDLGLAWRSIGDQIDSLTLCLNHGVNINTAGGRLALTDYLARGPDRSRVAWAGVVHGDEARAAYRAMCSLFLQPRRAWFFDGYKQDFAPPYSLPTAAKTLNDAGFEVSTNTPPHGGVSHWRARTAFGVPFDFIHINSSGNADFFDLTPGRAFASDVPFLSRPAMVCMIHSFSVQQAANPDTIGGRWLENGAYCYYGSMDEPFLNAFVPAAHVVNRLVIGAPFAAAVRIEDQRVWKLNVFGDPLATLGRPAPRHEDPLALDGAENVDALMRAALREKRLVDAATALILLGRDEVLARLCRAALAESNPSVTPELALIALPAAFREKDSELFLSLYALLTPKQQKDRFIADMLWSATRAELASTSDERLLNFLRLTIREESMCDDAEVLAPALKRIYGVEAARSLYGGLLMRAKADNVRERLQKEAARY